MRGWLAGKWNMTEMRWRWDNNDVIALDKWYRPTFKANTEASVPIIQYNNYWYPVWNWESAGLICEKEYGKNLVFIIP